MNDIPRITVIMGIYNCADTLVESLESLEAQTYKKFKVILCDDGSKIIRWKLHKNGRKRILVIR